MRQSGFTLIITLIFLVIMTILGLTMFNGFTLDQTIAGNLREKSRAFDAAQTAVNYAEWWLARPGNATTGVACSSTLGITNTPQVCSNNLLSSPTTLPWTIGMNYIPTGMSVSTTGGTAINGDAKYYANPTLYIQYIGKTAAGSYYSITGAAQGGNANAAAVLQSVYQISVQTSNLGNP